MDELIYIRIDEIAQIATIQQFKYWCKLLKIKPKIISRVGHVTNEEAEVLKKLPNFSYLKRFWYSLVSPERLRAY